MEEVEGNLGRVSYAGTTYSKQNNDRCSSVLNFMELVLMNVWPCPRLSLTTTLAKNAQVSLGLLTRAEKFEVTWENR